MKFSKLFLSMTMLLLLTQTRAYSMEYVKSISSYFSMGWSSLSSYFYKPPYSYRPVLLEATGNKDEASVPEVLISVKKQKECTICFDEKNAENFITLLCGHQYCTKCLSNMVDLAVKDKDTSSLKCPHQECKKNISVVDIKKITNDTQKIDVYGVITTREHLAQNPNAKHCRTPNCSYVYIYESVKCDEKNPQTHNCPECKKQYCAGCLNAHSSNMSCNEAMKRENHDNVEWMNQNTKQCPKCNTHIEKNNGCASMTCKNCHHKFCWKCLAPYNLNGVRHDTAQCKGDQQTVVAPSSASATSAIQIHPSKSHDRVIQSNLARQVIAVVKDPIKVKLTREEIRANLARLDAKAKELMRRLNGVGSVM